MHNPLADVTFDDLDTFAWPDIDEPGRLESTAETTKKMFEDTEFALIGRFGGPIIETAVYLLGYEK